jgi:cytochrome c
VKRAAFGWRVFYETKINLNFSISTLGWEQQMKRLSAIFLFFSLVCSVKVAHADTEALKILMQRNNCTACHMIDKNKYGPKFNEVAAKYADEAGAQKTLAAKIKAGGTGVWGEDIMPPQPQVSDADALTMAEYILALKAAAK